jgi:hypothetical protein
MSWVALSIYTGNKMHFTCSIIGMTAFFAGLLWYESYVIAETVFRKNGSSLVFPQLLSITTLIVTGAPLFVPIYIFFMRRRILSTQLTSHLSIKK